MSVPEGLKQALTTEDTVLFIGSGVSSWSGLPSWSQLIQRLAAFLDSLGRDSSLVRAEANSDLLLAASYGFHALIPSEISSFLRGPSGLCDGEPAPIHRIIGRLPPKCFVTTNYDHLIERSLRHEFPSRHLRVVGNRQPLDAADIMQARAQNFVFKPHGDIDDQESIILTREHYKKLVHGDARHAFETLRTLLATRRVVYIGYGLRDPDFLLIKDSIQETWKGGTREHYALIADVPTSAVEFWRRTYGITICSYPTVRRTDGTQDHSELLTILSDVLGASAPPRPALATSTAGATGDTTLALLRYANGLQLWSTLAKEIPLRVHLNYEGARPKVKRRSRRLHGLLLPDFLDAASGKIALLGLPGAGKTHATRAAASRLASRLQEHCIAGTLGSNSPIPVLVDMKLYAGDLLAMVQAQLPTSLDWAALARQFAVTLFVDSFNEMPRPHWESAAYEEDFARFLQSFPSVRIVVASRTMDGLRKLHLDSFQIDEIDRSFLNRELRQRGVRLKSRFAEEMRSLLCKPFFFRHLVADGSTVSLAVQPRDLYRQLLATHERNFESRFGVKVNLVSLLAPLAYIAVDVGTEVVDIAIVDRVIGNELLAQSMPGLERQAVRNWLLVSGLLLAYSGQRAGFFHQSVTEFLAAEHLATICRERPDAIVDKSSFLRWDHALCHLMGQLGVETARPIIELLAKRDVALACRATRYLDRSASINSFLLARIADAPPQGFDDRLAVADALSDMRLRRQHIGLLRRIVRGRGSLGGAALRQVARIRGPQSKDEVLRSALRRLRDYNFISQASDAITRYLDDRDAAPLLRQCEAALLRHLSKGEDVRSFVEDSAIPEIFGRFSEPVLRRILLDSEAPSDDIREFRRLLLARVLWNRSSVEAFRLAADLLAAGCFEAATSICFLRAKRSVSRDCWAVFDERHVRLLCSSVCSGDGRVWAWRALRRVARRRADMLGVIQTIAESQAGLLRRALLCAADSSNRRELLREIDAAASIPSAGDEILHVVKQLEIFWARHPQLLVKLLRLRRPEIASAIVESLFRPQVAFEVGDVRWWLDWISELEEDEILVDRLALILVQSKSKRQLIEEFNLPGSKYRRVLARDVLHRWDGLTTDDFSAETVRFLLGSIDDSSVWNWFRGHLLATTATEKFLEEHLVPLLHADGAPRKRVERILRDAGSRLGRRLV